VIDAASGVVSGSWNWKLLTLSNGGKQCAVFHERSGSMMIFQVNFYKIGQKVQRSFGVFSIETSRWSLYANKTTGVAEIQMDAEEAWLVPLIQDEDGRMVETWAMECRNGLYYTTDKSVSKTPVAVEYGPQLVSGSAIFLAFKLGVTDIYSKALPTTALQKTSSQKTTVEGAFFARRARPMCCRVLASHLRIISRSLCRYDKRHGHAAELAHTGERTAGSRLGAVDVGWLGTRPNQRRLHGHVDRVRPTLLERTGDPKQAFMFIVDEQDEHRRS
jgi:hypothetical protein